MTIIQITKTNFDQILAQQDLMVVSFSADWCKPCQTFKKVLEQISADCPEVTVAIIDIEKEKELGEEFKVTSVPATMILRQRTLVFAETGILSVPALKGLISRARKILSDAD